MMRRFNKTFAVTGILLAALTLAIFSTLWVLSPPAAAESARVSLPEANKALIQSAFEEVLNDGHLAAATRYLLLTSDSTYPICRPSPLALKGSNYSPLSTALPSLTYITPLKTWSQ